MKKELGQVFTPPEIVCFILNKVEYIGKNIIYSKILEPSFGEGVFLLEIINRIISETKKNHLSKKETENIIKQNVFGFEIDENLYNKTLIKIKALLAENNLSSDILDENLINEDALVAYLRFKNVFDYVVGNPPYVRIKNLPIETRRHLKDFSFTNGTTDLYIAFFEIAFYMINNTGKISFITPNSFLYNTSQQKFRKFLFENKHIEKIYNFEDIQIFSNVSTRTCISVLTKMPNVNIWYESKTENKNDFKTLINYKNLDYKHPYYLPEEDLMFINSNQTLPYKLKDFINIQNGIATNKDDVYIKSPDNTPCIEKEMLHPCIKASRCDSDKGKKTIIFPYLKKNTGYVAMTEEELLKFPLSYDYLLKNKAILQERDMEKNSEWFLFARSQGLKTLNQEKIVLKHIFSRDDNQVFAILLPSTYIVYSGLFITAKDENNKSEILKNVLKILSSPDFCKYVKILGRKKRGNYIEITADIIKNYGINNPHFI